MTTDIDALIERVTAWAWNMEADAEGSVNKRRAADLRALISLASPSPAQTEREPLAQPDENGCWYGVEHCTLPHCDCSERDKASRSPSPAQWPSDEQARSDWAYRMATARQGQSETPRCEEPHEADVRFARFWLDLALATLPPPDRLVSALATSEHIGRLRAALDAYPQGHSTDDHARLQVTVRAADLRQCLGDLHAYEVTWSMINREDAQPYKDALSDLLFCHGEQEAIGGGPGWQERDRKAWAAAEELMRIEP